MDEKDVQVEEFIDESLQTLGEEGAQRVFDENTLRHSISELEPNEPLVVEPQTPALEAITLMKDSRVGCVLVTRSGKLKGIFTERDVLTRVAGEGVDAAKTPVRKLMTSSVETLRPTDSIAYALNKMSVGGYRHIPLVDNASHPVGVISVRDIVAYIVQFFPKSVMNLPTLPRQNYAQEREGA